MPKPIKRRELIRRLQSLGWSGIYLKGRHPYMIKGNRKLTIPHPHGSDIDWSLTKLILDQAGIAPDEWDRA